MALEEKWQAVNWCAEEMNDDDVEDEIAQADVFTEKVQRAIINITNALAMKESPVT